MKSNQININKPNIIGITGGIGAGKSMVCRLFNVLGIPVFNADDAAKKLVVNDSTLQSEIKLLMGAEAYLNGVYNKKYISRMVFQNPDLLAKLNALIHPKVKIEAAKWLLQQKNALFYLYEAAIMAKAGAGNNFSKVIVVQAPLALRIERIKARDNRTEAEIMAIIHNQKTDLERVEIADYLIDNDNKKSIIKQVLSVYNNLTAI
jgi:dephospho-CoA kinase